MATIKLIHMAKYLEVSAPFLCELRKGRKAFSKGKARWIAEKTGLPLEKVLFTEGEQLYRLLSRAYSIDEESQP